MLDHKNQLWFLFEFLHDVEGQLSQEEKKQVMIEKAINLKLMCDYVVSCSYGDVVLIICMLHDYVRMLDKMKADDINYHAYYRKKFMKIADGLAEQIEYDYDGQLEKCQKKMNVKEKNDDIGEDAMTLAVKYSSNGKNNQKTGGDNDAKSSTSNVNGDQESTG